MLAGEPANLRVTWLAIALTALLDGLWLELCLDETVFKPAEAGAIAERLAAGCLEHFSSEVVPVRVKKNASKQKIRAHGLTQSGREML
ncbi:TetR family transcriptional regulator C-terminal domain-containing protein [Caulobacter sp. DWP3-1-3b2]|uniref:TetR family transcriptional regulator C-terminal domain-containing protein n=1 Tax=unclassified Caulobacter TaxID=2648921 RepID=UPI003CF54FAA